MKPHLQYLWYVLRHKWYVFKAGRILGLPIWQLLIHDLSKFSPAEWGPYVRHFHGPKAKRLDANKGYFHEQGKDAAFDEAWRHHWMNNPHHWQYWTKDNVQLIRLLEKRASWAYAAILLGAKVPMPKEYVKEMVADWYGAGMAQGKPDVAGWYKDNQYKIQLHDDTRADVIYYLGWLGQRQLIPRGWAA